jgi:hypothetical protein
MESGMSFILLANGPTIDKAPAASLVYGIDVADVLATGDTVSAVTGAASGGGLVAGTPSYVGSVLKVRLSGGTVGATGQYTFTWTTTGGDTDARTLFFNIKAR